MRSVLKFLFVILVASVNISPITAQKYYIEGNITNPDKQQLPGLIDYRNWKYNPGEIRFIPRDDKSSFTYNPSMLESFTVHNERFISADVTIERTPDKFNELIIFDELSINQKRIISEEQVFLRVLVEGETALYYYNERESGEHFYVRKGTVGEIIELKRYSTITMIEGKKELVVKDEYKEQLENLMNDCGIIIPLVHLSDYSRKGLTALIEEYNECMGKQVYYKAETPSVEFEMSILAGLSAFNVNFNESSTEYLAAAEFPSSYNPYAALGLNIIFPFARKTFSIYNELGMQYYKTGDKVQLYENENEYEDVEMDLRSTAVRILTATRYTYPAQRFKPFVYAGIVNLYDVSTVNNRKSVIHFYTTETEQTGEAIPEYRRYSLSLAAGMGIKYKHTGIDLRYERGSLMSKSPGARSCTNTVFLLLQYSF